MFRIDVSSRKPIYEQLCISTEQLISNGILKPGDAMPSVRKLAVQLSVNPNTIQRAYTDMCRYGYLCSITGKGCFVSENARDIVHSTSQLSDDFYRAAVDLANSGVKKQKMIEIVEKVYSLKMGDKEEIKND